MLLLRHLSSFVFLFSLVACCTGLKKSEGDSRSAKRYNPPTPLSIAELTEFPQDYKLNLSGTYFINLDISTDRRREMEHRFEPYHEFQLIRYPGVLGSIYKYNPQGRGIQILDSEKDYSYEYDPDFRKLGISPGEIGNYISHYELWKVVEKLPNPVLILEDDVKLADKFDLRVKSALAHAPPEWDMIFLYCNQKVGLGCDASYQKTTPDRRFLELSHSCTPGTVAYFLTPEGGEKLARNAMPISATTDDRIGRDYFPDRNFKAYCVYTEIIETSVNENSVIDEMGSRR